MMLRTSILSAIAGLALAAPAMAQTSAEGEFFMLNAVGERSWRVTCDLVQSDGDRFERRTRGRGVLAAGEIGLRDVVSAECGYEVPANGELQLTLDIHHTGFQCPFGASSDGFCQVQLPAGAVGRFSVRQTGDPAGATFAMQGG